MTIYTITVLLLFIYACYSRYIRRDIEDGTIFKDFIICCLWFPLLLWIIGKELWFRYRR